MGANVEGTEEILIVSRAISGNSEDIDWLIRNYQKRIGAFVFAMTSEASAVDDLLQAIFIKMALSIHKLRRPDQFERWLFQIARNACMSHLRKRKFLKLFESFHPVFHEKSAEENDMSKYYDFLHESIGQLPTPQRELLCLVQQSDYSYQELAEMTGSTVSSVRNHLYRAKETLRRLAHDTL